MAVNTSMEDRRRARAKGLRDELMGGADMLRQGVEDIDKKAKADQDRMLLLAKNAAEQKRLDAVEKRAAEQLQLNKNADVRAGNAEDRAEEAANVERSRRDAAEARAAAAATRAEEAADLERSRREAEESRKTKAFDDAQRKKQQEEAAARLGVDMAGGTDVGGGVSEVDLAARAAAVGMEPKELLAAADALEQQRLQGEAEIGRKEAESQAKIAKENALAKKAATPKPPPGPVVPGSEKDLRMRKLRAEVAKLEHPDGEKLTSGETEAIVELEGALAMLDRVAGMKEGADGGAPVDTGPIAAFENFFRNKVGAGDPRMVEFKATVGSQLADYIKSISGAVVSPEERKELLENVPTVSDDDEEFLAKLKSVRSRLEIKVKTKREVFKALGKDTRGIDALETPAPPAEKAPAKKAPEDMTDEELDAAIAAAGG